ncbi:lytic murein transglycosylase [Yoonia sp. F2084L]|uniref:lytic murein transglycosylase n=1 Tax=Yoonia sp. F2084L TaxID=2926419 RepID=UPI001FF6C189|nr:lytic murein transglycosylase [Yoonia sp. F2084L]MCK0096092.1 lytic murein transglycosylase [Yoonia sp. F2084L]
MHRRQFIATTVSALAIPTVPWAQGAGFQNWIAQFRGRARAAGISDRTFDAAFADIRYLPDSIERDNNQAEFVRPLADYMASAVSDTRVANGREQVRRYATLLSQIEARFDVEPHVVVAVWGMESNYGQRRGDTPLISTLATLAYNGRRGAFFESQLIAALKILQNGDVAPRNMTGSWAGAMGHTQFMPTSYEAYAVDFTGDGRRDIWADDPSDALASTAAYLRRFRWTKGQPWGVEVRLAANFDYNQTGRTVTRRPSDWARFGVVGVDGQPVPDYGDATLSTPTGAGGPAFLLFRNYDVISRYNNAEAYIIGVGHLSDRIRGAGPLQTAFPADERRLRRAERRELQQRLTNAGYSTQGVDGRIGPNSRAAIQAYQRSVGLPPDGHPSMALLERLR